MTIEIVDFPIKNGGSFHSYVNLPEGISINPTLPLVLSQKVTIRSTFHLRGLGCTEEPAVTIGRSTFTDE